MLRVFLIAIAVSGVFGQYIISPTKTDFPVWGIRSPLLEKFPADFLTPKIIKDLRDEKILTKSLDETELCLKFNIGCFDVTRMDEKKDEDRRKEEAMNDMIMREELCKKMGMDCRKEKLCEKMGVMCTKDEMCKKMGMDCSKKDFCDMIGYDCRKVDMCEKMGVMCTMDEMCKKRGVGCKKPPILFKTIKDDVMWVRDEFGRPILMDTDGRRILTGW